MVEATFSGPSSSFSINLKVKNDTKSQIRAFGISGRTSKFPITWDSFGTFAGPAVVTSTVLLDSEVVMVRFSGFDAGESVKFSGIDPDFTGDTSSGVRVGDIAGGRAMVIFSDGTTAFGRFKGAAGGTQKAVLK